MRHHNGAHAIILQVRSAAPGQRGPDGELHVLAVDLRHLLDQQRALGRLRQTGNRVQQFPYTHLSRHIANVVTGRTRLAGNGSTCAQNNDFSGSHLQALKNWLKIQLLDQKTVQFFLSAPTGACHAQRAQAHGRTGAPPTRAEIATELGFKSANAAEEHLQALARKGVIELVSGASRGIRLCGEAVRSINAARGTQYSLPIPGISQLMLPLVGRVAAGSPILAQEHVDQTYCVEDSLFQHKPDYLLN